MRDQKQGSPPQHNEGSSVDNQKANSIRSSLFGNDLWTNGLICAFEYVVTPKKKHRTRTHRGPLVTDKFGQALKKNEHFPQFNVSEPYKSNDKIAVFSKDRSDHQQSLLYFGEPMLNETDVRIQLNERSDMDNCCWVPIGWTRLQELEKMVQSNAEWASQLLDNSDEDDTRTVADVAAPYKQRPVGPTWWCHVMAGHPVIDSWLKNAQWLHPAISTALRDESRLISDRMKHLYYEVPVRVAGGLLFELLGQSVGDPDREEEDVPIVLRSWQAQNFLVTSLHVKGTVSKLNVLGIVEVQDLLASEAVSAPRSVHELIAHLACRLARWDDRLFRKYIFGQADEVELKFVNKRAKEDLNLLSIILNQEIKRLSTEVIRVKWSLHAREEIIFELSEHLRGKVTQETLSKIRRSTREMIGEQEAVRDRLFTVQDVMQNNVRAWLQDKSVRITHNLTVFGGGGLVLSIITGLFGINVDGIPGSENTPYAFALFTGILFFIGAALIGFGMLYFGLKKPASEEQVAVRKLELQDLVKHFQHDAETHAKVRKKDSNHPPHEENDDTIMRDIRYILIE